MSPTDTRERILAGFADQLLDTGWDGISLDHLATAIGIRRPSLYHHFPGGKEELFTAVALQLIDRTAARIDAALAAPDLTAQLTALALVHADDARQAALDQRIFDATRHVSDATRSTVSRHYLDRLLAPVEARMAAAVAAGELGPHDPWLLMQTFLEMAQVVAGVAEDVGLPPAERGEALTTPEELAAQVVALFLHGAAPRQA